MDVLRVLGNGKAPVITRASGANVARVIGEEAQRGYDLVVAGSGSGPSIGGAIIEQLVGDAPCHVAIMKSTTRSDGYKRLLVPVDGSVASRLAVDLALRYAEATKASLTLAILTERRPQAAAYADVSGIHVPVEVAATSAEELHRISVAFRASEIKPEIIHLVVRSPLERGRGDRRQRGVRSGRRGSREPRHPAPALLRL